NPASGEGLPLTQVLPPGAPSRTARGPSAVGALVTYAREDRIGGASAWARPNGRDGLQVALLAHPAGAAGVAKPWTVVATRILPLAVDSVGFERAADPAVPPTLVVRGAGAPDPLF